jgi:biopolymer transport protein TolQ
MDQSLSVSLIAMLLKADAVVQSVMVILAFVSIWSWAIIFDKIFKFSLLKKRSNKFEDNFEKKVVLEDIYRDAKANDNHPLARIFLACMHEWKSNSIKKLSLESPDRKNALTDRLMGSMKVAMNRSMQKMESGLNFLAIVGSSAPFIGLFGTVWGIMNSFQSIAVNKNTNLAVVAPGIAEALLATAMGLFAAIPAVFFYNIFSAKINQFSERASNFSIQLLNALSKELDK